MLQPKRKLTAKESATKSSRSGKSGKRGQSKEHHDERRMDDEEEDPTVSLEPEARSFEIFDFNDIFFFLL